MKCFIGGSKDVNADRKNMNLPESVCVFLNDLLDKGSEILIGDRRGLDALVKAHLRNAEYKKVTVYVSGMKGNARNDPVYWKEKRFPTNGSTPYELERERDFHLVEDCDYAMAIWNGDSRETFINMLCLCAVKKKIRLYLLPEDRWIEISSLEDLQEFKGTEGVISEKNVRSVLKECGFTAEMTDFLSSENSVSPYELIDVICRAPVSLEKKGFLMGSLNGERNIKYDVFASVAKNMESGKDFKTIKHDIRALMDCRGEKSFWTVLHERWQELLDAENWMFFDGFKWETDKTMALFTEWYDTDEMQFKTGMCGLFFEVDKAKDFIDNEEDYLEDGFYPEDGYYRMEAWDQNDAKCKRPRYDYYFYRGEICWFEKMIPQKQENGNTYYMPEGREFAAGDLDLNLRTPYKTGDIVLIDCSPFGPPFHAMILEARDQWNCCFPTIIFKYPGTDEWNVTPLKHRRMYKDIAFRNYAPMLSPLYRLRKIQDEEITEEDEIFLKLRKSLSGSEEKASVLYDVFPVISKQ